MIVGVRITLTASITIPIEFVYKDNSGLMLRYVTMINNKHINKKLKCDLLILLYSGHNKEGIEIKNIHIASA